MVRLTRAAVAGASDAGAEVGEEMELEGERELVEGCVGTRWVGLSWLHRQILMGLSPEATGPTCTWEDPGVAGVGGGRGVCRVWLD